MYTCTNALPIGFRRARTPWQQDLDALLAFARDASFAFVDFGPVGVDAVAAARSVGVEVGTVDLFDWPALLSPDAGRRKAAVLANAQHVRAHVAAGVTKFLTVLVPEDAARPRRENFAYAAESYRSLASAAAACGASLLLEGAPGRPPHFANLGCTPADLRAFLAAVDSPAVSVNFDPSHLVRMHVDPVRFLAEFGGRVGHVHAKDLLWLDGDRYDHGTLQQATFADPHVYGGHAWRYALPGRGAVPWDDLFAGLARLDYRGGVSIELEDADHLGDERCEKEGLRAAGRFLQGM